MLGPNAFKEAPLEIQRLMLQLQDYGIKDIARRIAQYGKITSSAEYQLTLMMEQDIFNKNFRKEIQKILGISKPQIDRIFRQAAKANYIYDKRAFQLAGIPFAPFEDNYFMQMLTNNIVSVTHGQMYNITNSLGFTTRLGNQLVFQPMAQFYQSQLDLATTSIATGVKTFNQALKDSVRSMANSGMRSVDYASGHQDRIDVAARRAIMGGMKDLTNTQSDYNAQIMGVTTFEISWHGGYRPSHRWGGRRFDTTGIIYPTEQELYEYYKGPEGRIGTLEDYNCYHEKYAVFPDSPTAYTDEQLWNMDREQNEEREYGGKLYNEYEARQQQRYIERVLRRQNSLIAGYEGSVEGDPNNQSFSNMLKEARIKKRVLRKQYRDFSDAMGLDKEFERIIREN